MFNWKVFSPGRFTTELDRKLAVLSATISPDRMVISLNADARPTRSRPSCLPIGMSAPTRCPSFRNVTDTVVAEAQPVPSFFMDAAKRYALATVVVAEPWE